MGHNHFEHIFSIPAQWKKIKNGSIIYQFDAQMTSGQSRWPSNCKIETFLLAFFDYVTGGKFGMFRLIFLTTEYKFQHKQYMHRVTKYMKCLHDVIVRVPVGGAHPDGTRSCRHKNKV